jgi:hypothetical protein
LSGLLREYWRMENCLHWVRDVTLGEDGSRVQSGHAPQVLAALRNPVLHLWSQGASQAELGASRAGVGQYLAARPGEALEILGFLQLE